MHAGGSNAPHGAEDLPRFHAWTSSQCACLHRRLSLIILKRRWLGWQVVAALPVSNLPIARSIKQCWSLCVVEDYWVLSGQFQLSVALMSCSDDEFLDELLDATELKQLGNDAFARKSWGEAIAHYSSALAAEPAEAHVIYSNR